MLKNMKNKIVFLTVILLLFFYLVNGQGSWLQRADFCGANGRCVFSFSIGGKGYVGCGLDTNTMLTSEFWEYDPSTNIWTRKANFGGGPRYGASGFSIGNKGYAGLGNYNNILKNDFWEYDPSTDTWTQIANFGGTNRWTQVGFSIGNKGYIGTGEDNSGASNDFWEYEPVLNTWSQKDSFPGQARFAAVGFSIGPKGYIGTGGYYDSLGISLLQDFWEYDPTLDTWIQKANFPSDKRCQSAAFSIGNCGYIGVGDEGNGAVLEDFWQYFPVTNQWTQKANVPGGTRDEAACFSIGNSGYIGIGSDIGYINDFWQYRPDDLEINENIIKTFISVFPNPFSSETTVKFNEYLKNASLTLCNIFGQELKIIKNISGQEIKLQRDNLSSGIYFIRFTQDNKTIATDKLIITE